MKPKNVVLLGCTGLIGVSAQKVVADLPQQIRIVGRASRGEVIADAGEKEGTAHAELDFAGLRAYRQEFPALQDMH